MTTLIGALAATLAAGAETLVFAPEDGVTTNVAERLTGATNVSANPGASGGGIVRLLAPYSDYTGTTANNCGTLWPAFLPAAAADYGSLGATSLLTLGRGTLKYDGQTGVLAADVEHALGTRHYCVYEVDSDLTLAGDFTVTNGVVVKTGPGTLRFACSSSSFDFDGSVDGNVNGTYLVDLKSNGDAPTQGCVAFTVLDGTVTFDRGTYVLRSGEEYGLRVGSYTATSGDQETAGIFEVDGADVTVWGWVLLGVFNGFTVNTPEFVPSSKIVVNSGSLVFKSDVFVGRSFYSVQSGFTLNTHPKIEVHGGMLTLSGACDMGNHSAMLSSFLVDGGRVTGAGLNFGLYDGSAANTNWVSVSGDGVASFTSFTNKKDENTFVSVAGQGVLNTKTFVNESGNLAIDLNGGALLYSAAATTPFVGSDLSAFTLGPNASVLGATGSLEASIGKSVTTRADAVTDGGLVISNLEATGSVTFNAAMAYKGPTVLKSGALRCGAANVLSSASALVLQGGTLVLAGAQQAAALTCGAAGTQTGVNLPVTSASVLTVSGAVSVAGTATLCVAPDVLTAGTTYDFIRSPLAYKSGLEALAARCGLAGGTAAVGGVFSVAEDGDEAVLRLTLRAREGGEADVVTVSGNTTLAEGVTDVALLTLSAATPTITSTGTIDFGSVLNESATSVTKAGAGTWSFASGDYAWLSALNISAGLVDISSDFDAGNNTISLSGSGSLVLRDGATLRCRRIATSTASCPWRWLGGTLKIADVNSHLNDTFGQSTFVAYLGNGTCTLDISEQNLADDLSDLTNTALTLDTHFNKDSSLGSDESASPITVSGRGAFQRDSSTAQFPSGFIFTNEAVYVMANHNHDAFMMPGTTLRTRRGGEYQPWTCPFDLGLEGATEPVKWQLPASASNSPPFAINWGGTKSSFRVYSPVEISIVEDSSGWKGAATCPPGVYTGIVYQSWIVKTTPDLTKFQLPAKYAETRSLTTELVSVKYGGYDLKALVFTIAKTGEDPEPPTPTPEDPYADVTLGAGESLALDTATTFGSLTLSADAWSLDKVAGMFAVTNGFALGLAAGEYASAKVSGDMTVKSGSVWKIDVNDALTCYDLLVVNGNLTVEKGALLDFGRTEQNPLPRAFKRVPLAKVTGTITAPGRLVILNSGCECERVRLTVEDGILFCSRTSGVVLILK